MTYLEKFRSPNIVNLISFEQSTVLSGSLEALILLEYCPGGHFLQRLNSRNGVQLEPAAICNLFVQILNAISLMHSANPPVVHRDLKLENILLGKVRIYQL